MTESVFKTILVLHIVSGLSGLVTGTINLAARKGGKRHRTVGRIFHWSMVLTGFSSLILAYIHPNDFLFVIGAFTLYMVLTGTRYIKQGNSGVYAAGSVDYLITGSMLLCAVAFVMIGLMRIGAGFNLGWVLIVFSVVAFRFVRTDFVNYTGKSRIRNFWLPAHIQRMSGAYIASLTAFLVVNHKYFSFVPVILLWLLPTIVITPLIIKWSRRNQVRIVE
jgi:uncharacterized membrane protein